jgi:hypothetical protein
MLLAGHLSQVLIGAPENMLLKEAVAPVQNILNCGPVAIRQARQEEHWLAVILAVPLSVAAGL